MKNNIKKKLYINDLLVDFSISSMINFYVHLGGNLRTHNESIDRFILFKHNRNSFINLHYTIVLAKNALNLCIEIMFKNGNILFINSDPFASKLENIRSKNFSFWIGKWPRGTISNYKTSSRTLFNYKFYRIWKRNESKTAYKINSLPTFVAFCDPEDNIQSICKEANYLGIPSFSFVDTSCYFLHMSYWSIGNNRSHYSNKFYHHLTKSVILKGKFMKIKKFISDMKE